METAKNAEEAGSPQKESNISRQRQRNLGRDGQKGRERNKFAGFHGFYTLSQALIPFLLWGAFREAPSSLLGLLRTFHLCGIFPFKKLT